MAGSGKTSVKGDFNVIRFTLLEKLLHRLNLLPQPINDTFLQPLLARAITVSNRLGLLDRLIHRPRTVEDLATELNLSSQGTQLLLNALELGGYVCRRGTEFEATAMAKKWLGRRSDHSVHNLLAYFETFYDRWGYLDKTIRRGRPEKTYFELFTPEDWRIYTYGMMDLARMLMPEVLKRIELSNAAAQLVDVGGSHGLCSIELCKKHPQLRATIVDLPSAAMYGKQIAAESGIADRISFLEGDFLKVDLGTMYHAALCFNVVHGLTPEQNELLARKIYRALRSGGKWYILDELLTLRKSSVLSNLVPAMVGLHLFNEAGGRAYEVEQVLRWVKGVGFEGVKIVRLRMPGVVLLECVKS